MTGLLAGGAVFLLFVGVRPRSVARSLDIYLGERGREPGRRARLAAPTPALVFGAATGAVLVPAGPLLGGVIGAGGALVVQRLRAASALRRRTERLGQELPAVADLLALYVLTGESVVGAMRKLSSEASGVAAEELDAVLDAMDAGVAFPEAARQAARESAHPDGARLHDLLAQAHRSGSRLVDALEMFAADRRAAISRELAAEGGRRALTGYGPILGLMIPTTLVFLMYPTLAGLRALSSTP